MYCTCAQPVSPGLIFCLDRAFPYALNEIIAEKAIAYRARGVIGLDIAGPESPDFKPADYRRLFERCRRRGLGITVHTGESGPVDEIAEVIEQLEASINRHANTIAELKRSAETWKRKYQSLKGAGTTDTSAHIPALSDTDVRAMEMLEKTVESKSDSTIAIDMRRSLLEARRTAARGQGEK